ncbi:MAG TPA: hypothetical protein VF787_05690, partial [Thermoanaerobaculia bacterium]
DDFLHAHRDYAHEPEPYEWLDEPAEPDAESFYRQLELSVERLRRYPPGARVIAERSPVDFLAYLLALDDLHRSGRDCALIASATELAAEGIQQLDLLIVLPLDDGIELAESEDLELREAMNERLLDLITTDPYALFTQATPRVVEIEGSPRERLLALEAVIE